MAITTRRYTEADDAWVTEELGRSVRQERHRIEIVEDGDEKAMALWVAKEGAEPVAFLGPVLVDASTERRDLFHAAIIATARAAVAEGFTVAKTRVKVREVVRILEEAYDVTFTPVGRNIQTGKIASWELTVDPREIIATAERKALV